MPPAGPFDMCDETLALRLREADEFYATVIPDHLSVEGKRVMRQAFAGLLWSKQFYHYIVREWLDGDPASPPPPRDRLEGRNSDWVQLYNADVISMPDKWEYPWYATWDLGFHCVAIALIDPEFAKSQLTLFLREWYMHPSGQLPAYEWALDDVNPPLHAWAVLRVYQIERRRTGKGDRLFLERAFHKLLLNFTWWVNRKDAEGNNVFQGGFLGLDNIGVFDRSKPLPTGGILEQSDGTSWMAAYSITMLAIAFELANENPAYEDVASKFWEHFLYIANAMSSDGGRGIDLWDEDDGFFYDVLHVDGLRMPLKVRSLVGLIPLIANATLEPKLLARMPGFKRRLEWFVENRPDLVEHAASMTETGLSERRLLSIVDRDQLRRILQVMLDPNEFLSDHGIRALSRRHMAEPYRLKVDGIEYTVGYEPAESRSGLFGGNSNWRGPVWFPAKSAADRGAAALPLLLRRRVHRGVPDRVGPVSDARGGRTGIVAPADADLPARGRPRPSREREQPGVPGGPALARPGAVLRVLQRRHRRRARREPPDGLDGARGQAAAAVGRVGEWSWMRRLC